jgi:hypothetical protein
MSQRIQVVLADPIAAHLRDLAASDDIPTSTLGAQFVGHEIARAIKAGKNRPLQPAPLVVGSDSGERAAWLEPYGGDPGWRRQMWGALVALCGRYRTQLEALQDGWWKDNAQTEILCALAVWRAELDETIDDPRDELAFQAQLADHAQQLKQKGGGVTKSWTPGLPPSEWDPQ